MPAAYIISLFYSLCAYTYFMLTRGATFDLGPFRSFWSERILHKNKTKLAFDQERWDYLVRRACTRAWGRAVPGCVVAA